MFRNYKPTHEINIYRDAEGIPVSGKLLTFTNIKVPITAEVFGIDGAQVVYSYISDLSVTRYDVKSKFNNIATITAIVDIDIQELLLATFKFVYIYPAQGTSSCHKSTSNLIIRVAAEEDKFLGLGLKLLLNIPQDENWHELPNSMVTSLFCTPQDLVELGQFEDGLSLLKASGASVKTQAYI